MDELIKQIDFEALKEALAQGLTYGGDLFYRFQDFVIWKSALGALFCFLLLLTIWPTHKLIQKAVKIDGGLYGLYAVFMLYIIPLVFSIQSIFDLIQVIFIPELTLIQYLN